MGADVERVRELLAQDATALYWSGCAFGAAGDAERAVEHFTACLEVAPDHPGAWVQRAYARLRCGDDSGARADLLTAGDLDPRAASVLLATLVRDPGPGLDTAAALDAGWAHLSEGAAPDPDTLRDLLAAVTVGHAQALADAGDLTAVLAVVARCTADPPRDEGLRDQLTRVCLRTAAAELERTPAGGRAPRAVEDLAWHARALCLSGSALEAGVAALDEPATRAEGSGSIPGAGTARAVVAGRRAETVRLLGESFAAEPATTTAHQLAVATLWPIAHGDRGPDRTLIARTVAMWAVVLADGFHCAAFGRDAARRYATDVPSGTVQEAVTRLETWLTGTLATAGGPPAEALFGRELLAARELAAVGGFRPTGSRALACGPLLLALTGHTAEFGRFAAARWGTGERATQLFSQLGLVLVDAASGRLQDAVEHLADLRCDRCRRRAKPKRSSVTLPMVCHEHCPEFADANPGYAGLAAPRLDFLADAVALAVRFRLELAAAAVTAETMDLMAAGALWREAVQIARHSGHGDQVQQHVTATVLGRVRYLRCRRRADAIALLDAFPLNKLDPTWEEVRHRVSIAHCELLNSAAVDLVEGAEPDFAGAAALLRRAVPLNRSAQTVLRNLIEVLLALAMKKSDANDFSAARALLQEAIQGVGRVPAGEPIGPELERKRELLADLLIDVRCDELMVMVRRRSDAAATTAHGETRRALQADRRPVFDEVWAGMLVVEATGLVGRDDERAVACLRLAARLGTPQRKDIDTLIRSVRRKMALDLNNRANELHQERRYDEAIALFDQALVLAPDEAVIVHNRAVVVLEKAMDAVGKLLEDADPRRRFSGDLDLHARLCDLDIEDYFGRPTNAGQVLAAAEQVDKAFHALRDASAASR